MLKSFWSAVLAAIASGRPQSAERGSAPALRTHDGPSPGQFGSEATTEVDPTRIARVKMSYSPHTDGHPDPGEIVWTWVPFEERDGRGKDRPVLVVASEISGSLLVAQLTSKNHAGEHDFVPIGMGQWDADGRASWVNLDRIFRVYPSGMRREAASLDSKRFALVARALRARYGWK